MNQSEVINTQDASFETDVMIRSQLGMVIVDFWAEWCAPCRTLGPVLEEVVAEFAGKVTLVKADTEKNQKASQQFGVAGIPAVFALLDGRIVDSFQGAMPADSLRKWIEGCLSKEKLIRIRQQLDEAPEEAETALRGMLEEDASDPLKVLLTMALHRQGKSEEVSELLDELAARGFLEPECEQIRAELSLQPTEAVDIEALRQQAAGAPEDLSLQFALAEGLAKQQAYEEAFEICLNLVQVDRKGAGEQARLLMLDVFKALGDDSEITTQYRRKLSTVLY